MWGRLQPARRFQSAHAGNLPHNFGKMKLLSLSIICCAVALCQEPLGPRNVLKVSPPETIKAKPGASVDATIAVQVDSGFHVNSNKPAESYLIPLKLTWTSASVKSSQVTFPRPELGTYGFSTKPVSVFTGNFDIVTRFKIASDAPAGPGVISGKLHYQACNDHECLIPKTVDVVLPVEIAK
jgi:hypothetical protein